jgi:hypothetical protein
MKRNEVGDGHTLDWQSDAVASTHFYTCDLPFYFVCERNLSAVDIRVALRGQLQQVADALQLDKHALLTDAAHTVMQPRHAP